MNNAGVVDVCVWSVICLWVIATAYLVVCRIVLHRTLTLIERANCKFRGYGRSHRFQFPDEERWRLMPDAWQRHKELQKIKALNLPDTTQYKYQLGDFAKEDK